MPNSSWWPLIAGVAFTAVLAGFLTPWLVGGAIPVVTLIGIACLIGSISGWAFEPAG